MKKFATLFYSAKQHKFTHVLTTFFENIIHFNLFHEKISLGLQVLFVH